MPSNRLDGPGRVTSALAGMSLAVSTASEATDAVPIVKQILDTAVRIIALVENIDKHRGPLHAFADKSLQLAKRVRDLMNGRTPDQKISNSLQRFMRTLDDVEAFTAKHVARSRVRRAISYVFTVPQQVERLSHELADAVQELVIEPVFLPETAYEEYGGNLVVRYHSARINGQLVVVRYCERSDPPNRQAGEVFFEEKQAERVLWLRAQQNARGSRPALFLETQFAAHDSGPRFGGGGYRFPFKFKNQHVEIKAPQMAPFAQGSGGRVIRAFFQFNKTIQNVALKILHRLPSPTEKELMRREMEMWSMTNHPRVLPYYGTCQVGHGQIALVAPYMKRGNLRQYLAENHGADRLLLVQQVAEGLEYLHYCARIVHGDLKCENVLIADDGSAFISDFGLSTFVEAGVTITPMELRMHHTLRFAAPELLLDQAINEGALDHPRSKTTASDVYAFAMLVYQACTGSLPWRDVSDMGVCLNILYGPLPQRPDDATLMNDSLWEICTRCWSRDPRERPRISDIRERL